MKRSGRVAVKKNEETSSDQVSKQDSKITSNATTTRRVRGDTSNKDNDDLPKISKDSTVPYGTWNPGEAFGLTVDSDKLEDKKRNIEESNSDKQLIEEKSEDKKRSGKVENHKESLSDSQSSYDTSSDVTNSVEKLRVSSRHRRANKSKKLDDSSEESNNESSSAEELSEDSDIELPSSIPSADSEVVRFEMSQENSVSFHHLIEYLKRTNDEGNLIFSKSGVSYRATGRQNTVFNCFQLTSVDELNTPKNYDDSRRDITKYEYRSNKHSINAGVLLETLQKFTRVGKKNRLVLSIYKDEDYLHVKQISNNKNDADSGIDCIKLKDVREDDISPGKFPKKENCSIAMSEFIDMCKSIVSIKSKRVTVRAYPKGIRFCSQLDGGLATKVRVFGICDAPVKTNIPDYLLELEKSEASKSNETRGPAGSSTAPKASLREISDYPADSPANLKVGFQPAGNRSSEINKEAKKKKINIFHETDINIETSRLRDLTQIAKIDLKGDVRLTLSENLPLRIACDIGDMGVLEIYLRDMSNN